MQSSAEPSQRRAPTATRTIILEIAWRWAFGLGALLLALAVSGQLFRSITLSSADFNAFRSRNILMITAAVVRVWELWGAQIVRAVVIAAIAISMLWLVLSGVGRVLTLQRIFGERAQRSNRGAVFMLSFLRVLWSWLCAMLAIAVVAAASLTASRGGQFNTPLYLLLVLTGLPLLIALWGIVNWYFSLAPVYCMGGGATAIDAIGQSAQAVAARRREFIGVSGVYSVPRFAALMVLVLLAAMAALLGKVVGTILIILLSLAYFAFADFLYIARLVKYAELLCSPQTVASSR